MFAGHRCFICEAPASFTLIGTVTVCKDHYEPKRSTLSHYIYEMDENNE